MKQKNIVMIAGGCLLLLCVCLACVIGGYAVGLPWLEGQVGQSQWGQIMGGLQNVGPSAQATDAALGLPGGIPPVLPGGALPTIQPDTAPTAKPGAATVVPTAKPAGSSTSTGNPLQAASNKAKSASKYRVEFSWVFGSMESGKYVEQPFFDMSGMVDGKNTYFSSKGGFLTMLAPDKNTTVEFIDADGKSYMKGVSMFGLTDPKSWYLSDSSYTSGFQDFAKPDEYSTFAGGKNTDFNKVGAESVDGQACDIWKYDFKSLQNAAVLGMLGSASNKNAYSAIDRADISVWLCGDGYVHKYLMDYEGHDAKDPTQKAAMKMTSHMWDYNNSAISVVAPKDAKPMPK